MIVIEGTNVINLIIEIFGIMICLFSLIMLICGSSRDRKTTIHFYCSFAFLLVYYVSLLLLELMDDTQGDRWNSGIVAAGFATFFTADLACFVVSNYLIFTLHLEKDKRRNLRIFLVAFMILHMILLFYAQAAGKLAVLDENGKYLEGDWNIIGYSMVPSYMILDVLILIFNGKSIPKRQKHAFFCYLGLPLFMTILRIFTPGVYLVAFSTCCSMVILLVMNLNEQQKEYESQHTREEQMKVDLMLSQIQPHFLFNALYVIQEICHVDPETASSAIGEFSLYLRHNMESLAISRPIPFNQELEHAKHYIGLQQLRFGRALDIRFDLQCTDFRMPTLTLQPIVENAIRYGVRQNAEGEGTVTISTKEYDDSYEIVVVDNGPGFAPSIIPADGLSHVGLANVRERLSRICGGTMEINSEPGIGTRVTMRIPKEN